MSERSSPAYIPRRQFPPGFRPRRGLNWGILGLMYTSYYLCRYNLPMANAAICAEFGYSKSQISSIISLAFIAYACGQLINGLLVDRLGGKTGMLIGAAGTILGNALCIRFDLIKNISLSDQSS